MKNTNKSILFIWLFLWLCGVLANAQSGSTFEITQSVIAGGGGQNSAGGTFALDGTIGQAIAGGALDGSPFAVTSGFRNFTPLADGQGFEANVAGRPNGDGEIQSNDVVQVQCFLIRLDLPFQSNEFQRAEAF